MINVTAKMRRMGAIKLSYGRDIQVYPNSKITDTGMMRFHALPTLARITVHYADGSTETMSKFAFEVLANCAKVDNWMDKHNF